MNIVTEATWMDLENELETLRGALPELRSDHPDDVDFLVAFAGVADQVRWRARHDEDFIHHVGIALTDMLIEAGLVPTNKGNTDFASGPNRVGRIHV